MFHLLENYSNFKFRENKGEINKKKTLQFIVAKYTGINKPDLNFF